MVKGANEAIKYRRPSREQKEQEELSKIIESILTRHETQKKEGHRNLLIGLEARLRINDAAIKLQSDGMSGRVLSHSSRQKVAWKQKEAGKSQQQLREQMPGMVGGDYH
ncbi:hypothetical protein AVEN_234063-1 [Araneus ventricosus]|uniref:Uncharacterized protein n=1 Tax=Araneus ventricosus TaxID=182803 RepID=A0A4Y2LND5_ARAVE|nr:hypothetical protein AVEN_89883-1 [Araneus ventricosus]GBN15994.1 hypothetical protein AVEN_234063-1 [Araneus ventricosus]